MLSFVSNIDLEKIINILLEPSVTLTLGLFTLLISRNSNLSTLARERLDKVYHPLFLEIEPFLYKKVSLNDINAFLSKYYELENSHSLLIDPVLRQEIRWLEKPSALQDMAIINGSEFAIRFPKHMTNYVNKLISLFAVFLIGLTTGNIVQKFV